MSDRYASLDVPQLSRIATERGIECPQLGEAPQEDRELLALLLRAYDAGRAAAAGEARERPPSPDALGGDELRAEVALQIEVLEVLRTLSSLPGHRGIDIGGTLSKTILGVPREALQNLEFKASFGKSGRLHRDLAFSLDLNGTPFEFVFFSGTTSKLEEAITFVSEMRAMRGQADTRSSDAAPTDQERHRRSRQIAQAAEAREDLRSSIILQSLIESDFGQTVVGKQPSRLGRVHVSGGGACKYPPLFLNAMGLSIEPVKELRAMVEGLLFLQETSAGSRRNDDPQGDLYTVDQDGRSVELPWPDPLFPLILVSFGTGVSILRVDSAEPNDFVRVGGTACGGGTFLGLARALTSAETFGEALDLAEGGDASHADKLVQDIYGAEGSKSLGLPGGLTACNFGKLCDLPKAAVGSSARAPQCACSEKDLARAALQMVTQQSILLASAFARQFGCARRAFFVGGYVDAPNRLARAVIASNFRNLDGCAYFVRHSDFLGALGCIRISMAASQQEPEGPP